MGPLIIMTVIVSGLDMPSIEVNGLRTHTMEEGDGSLATMDTMEEAGREELAEEETSPKKGKNVKKALKLFNALNAGRVDDLAGFVEHFALPVPDHRTWLRKVYDLADTYMMETDKAGVGQHCFGVATYMAMNWENADGSYAVDDPKSQREAMYDAQWDKSIDKAWDSAVKNAEGRVDLQSFFAVFGELYPGGTSESQSYQLYVTKIFEVISTMMEAHPLPGTVGEHCFKVGAYAAYNFEPSPYEAPTLFGSLMKTRVYDSYGFISYFASSYKVPAAWLTKVYELADTYMMETDKAGVGQHCFGVATYMAMNWENADGSYAVDDPKSQKEAMYNAKWDKSIDEAWAGAVKNAAGRVDLQSFYAAVGGLHFTNAYKVYVAKIFEVISAMMEVHPMPGTVGEHCFKIGAYAAYNYEP